MIEFTLVAGLLLMLTLGAVDFTLAFLQWNAATKAVQMGARLAAVSDPVCEAISSWTGLEGGAEPGTPAPAYEWIYDGNVSTTACSTGNADTAAIDRLLDGREGSGDLADSNVFPGVRDIYGSALGANRGAIDASNIVIRYTGTGLGFAGRPLGPVPTITMEITGLNFNFFFLNGLLGFPPIPMPRLHTTVTGEDLSFSN
jgi:hypothetical protein